MFLLHIDVSLPLFLPPFPSLKKQINEIFKKKCLIISKFHMYPRKKILLCGKCQIYLLLSLCCLQGLKTNSSGIHCTVMCHLPVGLHSKRCVIRRFHHCADIIQCTYTNLDGIAYYRNCMRYTFTARLRSITTNPW